MPSTADRAALLDDLASARRPTLVAFANAHGCNVAVKDEQFARDLLGADVLLRDGSGMALLCRALGIEPGFNMNGTDLIPLLVQRFAGRPVALVGTRDPWLSASAAKVRESSPTVFVENGFLGDDEYLEGIRRTQPALVVLGMGMPRQERLGALLRDSLEHPCTIVCGGAILDFLGGKVDRAPEWLQRTGLEWVWRLAQEPRRLFRRYIFGNVVFVARLPSVRRAADHDAAR